MALRDVKQYYLNILSQYVALKDDLADFEQGLKDGYVTEAQLDDIKNEFARLEENKNRLTYILYLFELPKRRNKKEKYLETNSNINDYFSKLRADSKAVLDENDSLITYVREELKKLKDKSLGEK